MEGSWTSPLPPLAAGSPPPSQRPCEWTPPPLAPRPPGRRGCDRFRRMPPGSHRLSIPSSPLAYPSRRSRCMSATFSCPPSAWSLGLADAPFSKLGQQWRAGGIEVSGCFVEGLHPSGELRPYLVSCPQG